MDRAECHVEWRGGRWQVQVPKIVDGRRVTGREWMDIPGVPATDEAKARRVGAIIRRKIVGGDAVPAERGETAKEYGQRWVKWRTERGIASATENESNLRVHLVPSLGTHPMRGVTRAHLEDFVSKLDAKVRDGKMNWKTAVNIWSTVSTMFADATTAKDRKLRVLDANPALGVRPPDKGEETAKQFLYPSEFLQLVSCADVPLLRRRLYAFAVYTYSRAGEIVPLTWEHDVDAEHGVIHFHQAVDRVRAPDTVKTTKTKIPRRIPIEPTLAPLLDALSEENSKGKVFPTMPPASGDYGLANLLRADLKRAKVERTELHDRGISTKPITFHDLRATGTTWMAVRGDEPLTIKQRAGHTSFQTTEGYIRLAEMLRPGFGEPFPALPEALHQTGTSTNLSTRNFRDQSWAQQDLKSEFEFLRIVKRFASLAPNRLTTLGKLSSLSCPVVPPRVF